MITPGRCVSIADEDVPIISMLDRSGTIPMATVLVIGNGILFRTVNRYHSVPGIDARAKMGMGMMVVIVACYILLLILMISLGKWIAHDCRASPKPGSCFLILGHNVDT